MKMKRWLSCLLALVMLLSLTACGGSDDEQTPAEEGGESSGEEIVINYPTFQVGTNTAAPVVAELVNRFNEEYAGQYRIEIEEVPGDANYAERIQVQISSGQLPPVVYGGGYALLDLALEADLVVDLTDVVNADSEWAAMYENDAWQAANCRDGKIYASSSEGQLIGYFYNKELFDQVGIQPATTWEEFGQKLDKPLAQFLKLYQPAFLQRIGLRYVNMISRQALDLEGEPWSELIEEPYLGILSQEDVSETATRQSTVDFDTALDSSCRAKVHAGPGMARQPNPGAPADKEVKFVLDFDLYMAGEIQPMLAAGALETLHGHATSLFQGAITDKLRRAMEPD